MRGTLSRDPDRKGESPDILASSASISSAKSFTPGKQKNIKQIEVVIASSSKSNTSSSTSTPTKKNTLGDSNGDTISAITNLMKNSNDTLVFQGKWAMREEDLSLPELSAPFRYERTGLPPSGKKKKQVPNISGLSSASQENEKNDEEESRVLALSGLFAGFFEINATPTQPASKFTEKNVLIEFIQCAKNKDNAIIRGTGTNKIGKYTINGELNQQTGEMTLYREYMPRRRTSVPQNRKSRDADSRTSDTRTNTVALSNYVETPMPPIAASHQASLSKDDSQCSRQGSQKVSESDKTMLLKLQNVLKELMDLDTLNFFSAPVDAKMLGLLDYHDIITNPMDLGTIKTRVDKGEYRTALSMQKDMELTFSNALLYNARGSAVHKKASELSSLLGQRLRELLQISTPRCTLGKRQSVPKVAFEVVYESKQSAGADSSSTGSLTTNCTTTTSTVRSTSNGSASTSSDAPKPPKRVKRSHSSISSTSAQSEDEEVIKLKAQIAQLSKHLKQLQQGAMMPLDPAESLALPAIGMEGFVESLAMQPTATSKSTQPAAPKRKKRSSKKSQFTYEMKRRLGRDLNFLNGEKLRRVLDLIKNAGIILPVSEMGELVLDIDLLDDDTFMHVRKFVARHLQAIQPNYRPC